MSSKKNCPDVYSLLTDLSKQILRTQESSVYYPGFQQKSDIKVIKKLRSKAFEILLNKSPVSRCTEGSSKNEKDPLAEILKHTFVLKCIRRVSQALQLEALIEELPAQDIQPGNTIYAVLQLLIELKSFHGSSESEFNIFHYGRTNPALPEVLYDNVNVPLFQTYPMEVFLISDKFEALLKSKHQCARDNVANSTSKMSFIRYLKSSPVIDIESVRNDSSLRSISLPCTSLYSSNTCLTDFNMVSYFLPLMNNNKDIEKDYFSFTQEGFIPNLLTPYAALDLVTVNDESGLETWKSSNGSICNEVEDAYHDFHWNEIDLENTAFNLRTWETLGSMEASKQPLFTTDTVDVVIHLATIKQASTLVMLPESAIDFTLLLKEVPIDEFLKDVKLLLFGIESNSFEYTKTVGFSLKKSIIIHGVTSESLNAACQQVIHWGNCFKSLSWVVEPDPQSGKFQQSGLIFKAMCMSIKELLLYYRAALLRIFNRKSECNGLMQMFEKVRPMAILITEVARLCQRNEENNLALSEGNGILTMIYGEVTKVTNPQVALVFYSILKSCCEVYFRFLQKWLFEGVCDDVYGEFMIKARPQYLRHKGHKFWTKSFIVCSQSVPGFLTSLTDSILQCGKAVRLLKICDPKNPVCRVFTAYQPDLKVCLSVAMLREQLLRCQEYENRGETALGPIVSLASAIQEQKDIEREKTNIAVRIQQDTSQRAKGEQEELAKLVIEKKKNFLKVLKEQASEVALHKEKQKEAELLADKLLLEKINQEQEEAENVQVVERLKLLGYYEELAGTIENRRLRSEWRVKRMNYHEKRVNALAAMKTDAYATLNNISGSNNLLMTDATSPNQDGMCSEDIIEIQQTIPNNSFRETTTESELQKDHVLCEDENKNVTESNTKIEILTIHDTSEVASTNSNENKMCPMNVNLANTESVSDKMSVDKLHSRTVILGNPEKVPNELGREKQLYRRNNERSDLQEYLRTEVTNKSQHANDANKTNANTVNRPTFLKFQRLDNMTVAQLNKMKILQQEYGMTPNNNEFRMILTSSHTTTDNTDAVNENDNMNKPVIQQNIRNNEKNWEMSHILQETPLTTHSRTAGTVTKLVNITEDVKNELTKTEKLLYATDNSSRYQMHSENNVDTPMSCTTDHFAPSSSSPISQLQTCENATPSDISSDMLSSFEAIKSCPEQNFILPENRLTFSTLNYTTPTTPCATPSLTIADVELIDNTSLQMYLEKSITVPLQVQSRLVNNAIIKYLLNEHSMLIHLHSLRSYFFLLNGEFAKSLTDALYSRLYNISVPIELFNSATLTNLLERALVNSFSSSYINSEFLSLSAVDIPHQLHISDPDALDCLCLNYKISWPLNIILDDMVMLQYSKVFKFLIMIGRVSWVLQEDFNIMKVERKAAMSEQYHRLQLYRHAMTQFINALHNYLTCSVLHASWTEFEKDLQNSMTLDQVYMSHVAYIKKILSRCMLNIRGEKMRTCLNNIFKVILQFHNRLRSQSWTLSKAGYIHPNFKKLDQMYKAFCELRTYMAHVALKYTTSGYQPHLIHFLNALNINSLYDLTIKVT